MALGPGKYDEEARLILEKTKAKGVILLVCDGDRGFGMACLLPAGFAAHVPELLRRLADDIERSAAQEREQAGGN